MVKEDFNQVSDSFEAVQCILSSILSPSIFRLICRHFNGSPMQFFLSSTVVTIRNCRYHPESYRILGKQSKIPRCPVLSRFFVCCPCMLNIADILAGFDELINSAISECDINSQSIPLLNVEKERIEANLLEKLPEDYCYKFNISVINEQNRPSKQKT